MKLQCTEGLPISGGKRRFNFCLTRTAWAFVAIFAMASTLTACGDPPPKVVYKITSVLPNNPLPGDTVTVYGVFPKGTNSAFLGSQSVAAVAVPGGLRVTLPDTIFAGLQDLTILVGGSRLITKLQVRPVIDATQFDGQNLVIVGRGWPKDGNSAVGFPVEVVVAGLGMRPTYSGAGLQVSLPLAKAYGAISVGVRAGGEESDYVRILREAASVSGSVVLPGAAQAASVQSQSLILGSLSPKINPRALLVFSSALGKQLGLENLSGVKSIDGNALLGVFRVEFFDEASCQNAFAILASKNQVIKVEYENVAGLDGGEEIPLSLAQISPRLPAKRKRTSGELSSMGIELVSIPVPSAAQWQFGLMGLPEAWNNVQGEGVVVAVVDTGVYVTHPDLAGNVLPGYDFVDSDSDPTDTYGHGTHVAGMIAANGLIVGVAPKAQILPVRTVRDAAGGSTYTIAVGILWAAGLISEPPNPHPAQIINLSLGINGGGQVIEDAVKKAMEKGVIVVAATGNGSSGVLATPASTNGVLSVTSVSGPVLLYRPWYANYGDGLQVSAFGGDMTRDQDNDGMVDGIASTDLDEVGGAGYGLRMGTSMASPQVAGLVALALSRGIPAGLAAAALSHSAVDLDVWGYDTQYGYGLATGNISKASVAPELYVAALDDTGKVLTWATVGQDLSFTLNNMPPSQATRILVGSDQNGNGLIGESGELLSEPQMVSLSPRQMMNLQQFQLDISNGERSFSLLQLP